MQLIRSQSYDNTLDISTQYTLVWIITRFGYYLRKATISFSIYLDNTFWLKQLYTGACEN